MQTITHEMRGIPFFLLKEYLEEMGGKEVEENLIQGEGWTVRLEKMEPFRLFSLTVGQVPLVAMTLPGASERRRWGRGERRKDEG